MIYQNNKNRKYLYDKNNQEKNPKNSTMTNSVRIKKKPNKN